MNIFNMAREELKREGKLNGKATWDLFLDRVIAIRKHLDKVEKCRKMAEGRKNHGK